MSADRSRYRWFVVGVFFFFMLLHQTDKLLIGPLESQIRDSFQINKTQMGAVLTGSLIVGTIFYPLWGYLYDRYARSKLLALASFIWGATTWLSSVARTFPQFVATRASTGIDDSSYPGIFTLVADYFGPNLRGKVYGLLQLSQPIGYLLGTVLALMIGPMLGWDWRTIYIATGSLGIALAVMIFFGIREMPRGKAEPEFENMTEMASFHFSWDEAKQIFRKRTMWFVFLQGFVGVFPWNVIVYWFFTYLEEERGYDQNSILFTMAPVILVLAAGYFVGGALGDYLFKRTNKGRIIISNVGVLLGAIFAFGPFSGTDFLLKGFVVALAGGLGSVAGAMTMALVLGYAETFLVTYSPHVAGLTLGSNLRDVYAYAILIACLAIRPSGIFRGTTLDA